MCVVVCVCLHGLCGAIAVAIEWFWLPCVVVAFPVLLLLLVLFFAIVVECLLLLIVRGGAFCCLMLF